MSDQQAIKHHGRRETFRIIETHPAEGPSLEEVNATLGDWFYGLLITGELRKSGQEKVFGQKGL